MSKKEIILTRALELFNEKGIEYVGVREIASDLKIRVGNVTYYFPTKEDIILALAEQLRESNGKINRELVNPSIMDFLEMFRSVFQNQYKHRCLTISMVNLLAQNKKLASFYGKTAQLRKQTLKQNIKALCKSGFLRNGLSVQEENYMVSSFSLISRFWISEAQISYSNRAKNKVINHYLALMAGVIRPFATVQGINELDEILQSDIRVIG